MRQHSAISFGGLVTATLALAALLGLLVGTSPADESTVQANLLVKCAPETVPAVLRALRDVDAEVFDLATLKPYSKARPAPLGDAFEVMKTLRRVAARVAADAGDDVPLSIDRMEVKPRLATLHVRARSIEALDALRQALEEEPALRARAGAAPRTLVGATRQSDPVWEQTISLRLAPPDGVAEASTLQGHRITRLSKHLNAAGTRLAYAGAERIKAMPGRRAAVVSQQIRLAPTTLEALMRSLDGIASEPGWVITQVSWTRDASSEGKTDVVKNAFEISCIALR